MDLLKKFEAVTVQADNRISLEDKAFCERHQAAYKSALQSFRELVFFWEDMVGQQKVLLCDSDSEPGGYLKYLRSGRRFDLSTEDMKAHIEDLHDTFIETIVGYFNSTYKVSVSTIHIKSNLMPSGPEYRRNRNDEEYDEYHQQLQAMCLRYQDIVDQIILLLDGRSFYEQAFHELADRCHLAAWNQYKKEACFEQKKHTIRFNGYFCTSSTWMHSTEWTLNNAMKDILRGAAHYETNSFHICPFDITELLGYGHKAESEYEFITCEKVKGLKMFKNGRVDLRFAADTNAREFIERYLGTAV